MNNNNHNNNNTDQAMNDNTHSLSMLLEAAGDCREAANATMDSNETPRLAVAAHVRIPPSDIASSAREPSVSVGDTNGSSVTAGERSLSMLASAVADETVAPTAVVASPLQASVAAAAGETNNTTATDAGAAKSRSEIKKQRAALLKAAKALSNDPLVQLSMLRAMEQQQVAPDVVQKNKEEREKAAEARLRRSHKKRKATVSLPPAAPAKSPRHRVKDKASKRAPAGGCGTALPAAFPQPQLVPPAPAPVDALEALTASLSQPQNNGLLQSLPSNLAGGSDQVISGTLQFVHMLLGMMQQNSTLHSPTQALAGLQALQGLGSSGFNAPLLDLIQDIGSTMPAQQKVALAQALVPHLGAAASSRKNVTNDGVSSQGNGTSALNSSLCSSQKDSRGTSGRDSSPRYGQEVKIPCRARGMPSEHNFQVCPFSFLASCYGLLWPLNSPLFSFLNFLLDCPLCFA